MLRKIKVFKIKESNNANCVKPLNVNLLTQEIVMRSITSLIDPQFKI